MMEYGNGGGGSGGSGGERQQQDSSDRHKGKKKYHRHTAHQIQKLETMFKECPHPDEKTRLQLSRELGLAPRQIKFWFQNRRTQIKAQHERADNCGLRGENDRIRCENIAIREALKNIICPSCGGPPVGEDTYFDEQKLRIENRQLKEQLDRVSSIATKYIGRPISQLPPVQPIHISSLDLSMSSFVGGHTHGAVVGGGGANSSLDLDLDLFPGSSSSNFFPNNLHFLRSGDASMGGMISDMDRSLMAEIATNAMNDLIKIFKTNDPSWMDNNNKLGGENNRLFSRPNSFFNNPNVHVEASRYSGVVIMNALALVDMFMDANKWVELFPTIVSTAKTIQVLSSGLLGNKSGTLQLMYEELQVLSPFVPNREIYFIRYCQQIEQGSWVIVDVSYDILHHHQVENLSCPSPCKVFKYPSGCWIQDMPNGYSKVTWVEHVEVEETLPVHKLFKDVIHSGKAFGAERWVASLIRMCERFACMMVTTNHSTTPHDDLGGVIPSPQGKRSMRILAQRMVSSFCSSIINNNNNKNNNNNNNSVSTNNINNGGHQWSTLNKGDGGGGFSNTNYDDGDGDGDGDGDDDDDDELEVRTTIHKTTDPGQPNGVVLSAATTIWLPIPPLSLFNFFRDERTRHQWDVLSNQNPFQEVAHIANGSHPGNCISLLRALNTSQNNMLVLQESCIDSCGALVVYCPVDLASMNIAMSGEDPTYIPLLPSGFTITPDGRRKSFNNNIDDHVTTTTTSTTTTSTSINGSTGSLVTVVLQILVSNMPTAAKMSQESVSTVNNLITNTVHQIKAALNCYTTST